MVVSTAPTYPIINEYCSRICLKRGRNFLGGGIRGFGIWSPNPCSWGGMVYVDLVESDLESPQWRSRPRFLYTRPHPFLGML